MYESLFLREMEAEEGRSNKKFTRRVSAIYAEKKEESLEFDDFHFPERQPASKGCKECCCKCCYDCECYNKSGRNEQAGTQDHNSRENFEQMISPYDAGVPMTEMTPEQWEDFNREDRGSAFVDAVDGMIDALPDMASSGLALDVAGTALEIATGVPGVGLIASTINHCIDRE